MTEINIDNFNKRFPVIKEVLKNCKFVSLDLEFSALYPLKNESPSLFDTPAVRYKKCSRNIEHVVPIQVGITAFNFNPDFNTYKATAFNFYVVPASFQSIEKNFSFQSKTIHFLKTYKFDFNKFVYLGVPYLNRDQEADVRNDLKNNTASEVQSNCIAVFEEILNTEGEILKDWYHKSKPGDVLEIPKIWEKCSHDYELLYFIQKNFRTRFKNLWTTVENDTFVVKILTDENYSMVKNNELEEQLIDSLLGFSKIIRLLIDLKKPIIGHNLYQDILLIISSFETALPQSYQEFKKLATSLFPTIFDTKYLSFEIKKLIPDQKIWNDTGLNTLFEYFKNGNGRHLANNSPAIEIDANNDNYGKFHDAVWDSFCAGYIFIRLAHLNIYSKFPMSKTFVPQELIGGVAELKNKVNMIRASTSSINLDGPDPISTRPPFLVVESLRNKPVDLKQVTLMLSAFGFVEVRKIPIQRKRALVAVDNFGSARRILSQFNKTNSDFKIGQYNVLVHSPLVRVAIMSGVTLSSGILLWIAHSVFKK